MRRGPRERGDEPSYQADLRYRIEWSPRTRG